MATILIVEDEGVIALDLECLCIEAGWSVAGPFSKRTQALAWLEQNAPDAAILDTGLADGSCAEIARLLEERGVPWVIFSGSASDHAPDMPRGTVWIEKPATDDVIRDALSSLLKADKS
ncbi:response regulator [Salinarimonas rosea]|uniref:response regulator n=1 Tax=Salinarimonas rosea TaxID=552063 RepID=UPI0009FCBBE3|nr:response regulator [Salinarimonas rosea]